MTFHFSEDTINSIYEYIYSCTVVVCGAFLLGISFVSWLFLWLHFVSISSTR